MYCTPEPLTSPPPAHLSLPWQLRWLLDPPPEAASALAVPAATAAAPAQGAPGATRRCALHRAIALKEAVPLPVFQPAQETIEGLLAIGGGRRAARGGRGGPRRKSDVVLLRRGDGGHGSVAPADMPVSRCTFSTTPCLSDPS